jgi:hypothetical protein
MAVQIRWVNSQSSGNAGHDGTKMDPQVAWLTIQYGLNELAKLLAAKPADTGQLNIVSGTYKENLVMLKRHSKISVVGCDSHGIGIATGHPGNIFDSDYCEVRPRIDGGGSPGPVFDVEGATAVKLKCLTVLHGNAAENGGGIFATGSQLTVDSCCIRHNKAGKHGGGIAFDSCTNVELLTTLLLDNTTPMVADAAGGGVWINKTTTAKVDGTWFYANSSQDGGGLAVIECSDVTVSGACLIGTDDPGTGQAIFGTAPPELVTDPRNHADRGGGIFVQSNVKGLRIGAAGTGNTNKLTANYADRYGGAIAIVKSSVGVVIENNELLNSKAGVAGAAIGVADGFGGGVYVEQFDHSAPGDAGAIDGCKIQLTDNKIQRCSASADGGGLFASTSSHVDFTNDNTLASNTASNRGGAIAALLDSSITFNANDSGVATISDNVAILGKGGGLYLDDSRLDSHNAKIVNNHADQESGGGIFINGPGADSVYLTRVAFTSKYVISNTDVEQNAAGKSGGGLSVQGSNAGSFPLELQIDTSEFRRNSAAVNGGAFLLDGVSDYQILSVAVGSAKVVPGSPTTPGANSAKEGGGGGYISDSGQSRASVKDSNNLSTVTPGLGFFTNVAHDGAGLMFFNCPIGADTITGNEFDKNELAPAAGGKGRDIYLKGCTLAAHVDANTIAGANLSPTTPSKKVPPGNVTVEK